MQDIHSQVTKFAPKIDSIICVAGGFQVGSVQDVDVMQNYDNIDRMNFQSALLTGHLATKFLAD